MSWYLVVLLIVFYIVMWCITAITLSRLTKNPDPEWIALGMVWPLVLACVPFVAVILLVSEIVDRFGYMEVNK